MGSTYANVSLTGQGDRDSPQDWTRQ